MSTKTKRRLSRFADRLEAVVNTSIKAFAGAVELILIDAVFGNARFRKHGPKMRPIIHRTYVRNIVVRERPLSRQERVHIVMNRRG